MTRLLACLTLLALAASHAHAGGCFAPYRAPYYPAYSYPVYGPTFTAQVYYPPVQKVYVPEVVVPAVTTITQYVPVQVAAFSAGYVAPVPAAAGSAAPGVAQGATTPVAPTPAQPAAAPCPTPSGPTNADILKAVVGINDSLRNTTGRLERLEEKVFGAAPPPPDPKGAPPPPVQPAPVEPPAPTPMPPADPVNPDVKPSDPQAMSDLKAHGGRVLAARCASCHDAADGARKGEGHVFTSGGARVALSPAKVAKIVAKIEDGSMPPAEAGGPLGQADRQAVKALVTN